MLAIAALLVLVPFSFLLVQVTSEGSLTKVDTRVALQIHDRVRASPALESLSVALSFIGNPAVTYALAGAAAIYFLRRGSRRLAAFLVVTNLAGGAINSVLKLIVNRPRPQVADPIAIASGLSFPSGHTVAATVGFGSLLLAFMPLVPRRWRVSLIVAYVVLVAGVAASRLGLVVHYVSDVVAGSVVGLAWLALATAAFSIWRAERGKPQVDVLDGVEPEIATATGTGEATGA